MNCVERLLWRSTTRRLSCRLRAKSPESYAENFTLIHVDLCLTGDLLERLLRLKPRHAGCTRGGPNDVEQSESSGRSKVPYDTRGRFIDGQHNEPVGCARSRRRSGLEPRLWTSR